MSNQRQIEIEETERLPLPRKPGCFRFIHIRPKSGKPEHYRFVLLYQKDRMTLLKWAWMPGLEGWKDFRLEEW